MIVSFVNNIKKVCQSQDDVDVEIFLYRFLTLAKKN
jgi:hypothetical protein